MNKKFRETTIFSGFTEQFGDSAGIRTPDPLLKRQLLCRLSYRIAYGAAWTDGKTMAGTAGLEPADEGVKVPCLTTWLRPNMERGKRGGMKKAGITGTLPAPRLPVGWVMGLEPTTPGTTIRCSAN